MDKRKLTFLFSDLFSIARQLATILHRLVTTLNKHKFNVNNLQKIISVFVEFEHFSNQFIDASGLEMAHKCSYCGYNKFTTERKKWKKPPVKSMHVQKRNECAETGCYDVCCAVHKLPHLLLLRHT